MNSLETIEETLFPSAVSAIRSGNVDEGLDMLGGIDGEEIMKNLVKAQVAYWRGDWKDAMYCDEHSLSSDNLWRSPFVVVQHLRAYVMAAMKIGAISRAKCFLEYYISLKRNELGNIGARPFVKIFNNAMLRLDGQPAHDEPMPAKFIDGDESACKIQMYSSGLPVTPSEESAIPVQLLLEISWNRVPTRALLSLYEQYADFLLADSPHFMAARHYLALNDASKATASIMRILSRWVPDENFEVMPMKYFVYKDVADYIFDSGLNFQMLATPKENSQEHNPDPD